MNYIMFFRGDCKLYKSKIAQYIVFSYLPDGVQDTLFYILNRAFFVFQVMHRQIHMFDVD